MLGGEQAECMKGEPLQTQSSHANSGLKLSSRNCATCREKDIPDLTR